MNHIFALIFDFDETIVPDSITELISKNGIDPDQFWNKDVKKLIDDGYDSNIAWLRLILENIGVDKPLGLLTNDKLRDFGSKCIQKKYFTGFTNLIPDIKKIVEQKFDYKVEFYIISGGLKEIIQGCEFISEKFKGIYGSQLGEGNIDGKHKALKYIKKSISFTEKTRYLFEINKGIKPRDSIKNPYLVNEQVEKPQRRIPMENMIYIGDGLSDIPCFSLLEKSAGIGHGYGIFDPNKPDSARDTLIELLHPRRVVSAHAPLYGATNELGALLRASIAGLCKDRQDEDLFALGRRRR